MTMTSDKEIIVPIFTDEVSGSLLKFGAMTGAPTGMVTNSPVLVGPTMDLARPIGVLFLGPATSMEPAITSAVNAPEVLGELSRVLRLAHQA
jgi:hypothetical protein